MKEIGKERKIAIVALIVAVLMLTVAFAAMSRTLKINGTAKVDSAAWDIHFKSAEMKDKKGDAREVAGPVISEDGIDLTLKVGLRKPKDEITYEAVIENSGDIDAEIESIEYPTLTDDQAKIIEFVATYQNGDEISKSQELKSKDEKTVKIVIRYKDITDESLLAKEAYDVPLTFKINYIQKGFNTESTPEGGEIVDDGSKVVLASTDIMSADDPSTTSFANSPITRSQIETLTFSKGSNSSRTGNSWDASAAGDGSITGYYTDSDSNGLYEVIIESPSNIYAPADATAFFAMFMSLKELDLNNFKTNDITNMMLMFARCPSLTSIDLTSLNTSNVTDMTSMFLGSSNLITVDMSNIDVSNVTTMERMFAECSSLVSLDLSTWDTSNVTNMAQMFVGDDGTDNNLKNLLLTNWNTSNVTTMEGMFSGCDNLESLDLSSFNTSKVTNMSNMFDCCSSLATLNINHFNTSNVTDMTSMFSGCSSLTSLDLSNWDTSNVTTMEYVFSGCETLQSLNLSSWNTKNVTDMSWMFSHCSSLLELRLNNADFSNVTDMDGMFYNVSDITIYVKDQAAIDFLRTTGVTNVEYKIEPLQS